MTDIASYGVISNNMAMSELNVNHAVARTACVLNSLIL